MLNPFVQPVFDSNLDELLFVSRLWNINITLQDVIDYNAYKLDRPTRLGEETDADYRFRVREWDRLRYWENSDQAKSFYVLSKWERWLGKVQPEVDAYLATRPIPNRTQSREACRLQLNIKFKWHIDTFGLVINVGLIPLIQGIVTL